MSTHRRLKIASRISALLEAELGEGIDPPRMVVEPLYARDVLLVCDAMPDTALATLAAEFRTDAALGAASRSAQAPKASAGEAEDRAPHELPPFSASRFFNSIFGTPSTLELRRASALPRLRGWLGRSSTADHDK